jgi:uncharacterized membrane protein
MGIARRITYAAVLAGYVLGAVALSRGLPGDAMAAFLLPTAVVVIDVLLRMLTGAPAGDPDAAADGVALVDAMVVRVAVFILGVHAAVIAALVGWVPRGDWVIRALPLMLGLTMVSIGNLLPRTRPNLAIGIRTTRTLADRACWIRTHRDAGYLIVASGAIVALSALAIPIPVGPRMIQVVGPMLLIGLWLLVRREHRRLTA